MTAISEFYAGRVIFLTGVTGFIGKVLLEKLLRSCPEIHRIYVLIRPKRGVDVASRSSQLLQSELFDAVRREQPDFYEKVVPVPGDILEPNLGLSASDIQNLTAEVSIVFHSAATVKFEDPLKFSVQMNVVSVDRLIELCHQMAKIEALIHISTAYANCDRSSIEEVVYPSPISPQKIISAIERMSDADAEAWTKEMIKPRPNTYTFTKAIAEHLLIEKRGSLPCAIVRPSIVGASWHEPVQGWVDNFNGPSGILAAVGKGIGRIMMCRADGVADIVPVDIAINLIIAAAWSTATERPSNVQVFNCTTGQSNKAFWGQLEKAMHDCYLEKNPLDDPIRLPDPKVTLSKVCRELHRVFDHLLPALMMDIGLKLTGQKPRLLRLQSKLWRSIATLEYFTSHQWKFSDDNVVHLFSRMCDADQKLFNFDVKQIYWPTYFENYCLGIKLYALKESMANLPRAKQAIQRLILRRRLRHLVYAACFCWMVIRWNMVRNFFRFNVSLLLHLFDFLGKLSRQFSTLFSALDSVGLIYAVMLFYDLVLDVGLRCCGP